MQSRLIRTAVTSLATILLCLLPFSGTRVLATDSCFIEFTLDGYWYAGGQWQSVWGTGSTQQSITYEGCEFVAQTFILDNGSLNCTAVAGVNHGTYGVAYVRMSWNAYYYGSLMNTGGPIIQQYDCGDL